MLHTEDKILEKQSSFAGSKGSVNNLKMTQKQKVDFRARLSTALHFCIAHDIRNKTSFECFLFTVTL